MGITISLIDRPIERPCLAFPLEGSSGAVVEFFGVVRGREGGKPITALAYEAYREMAKKELERIAEEVAERGLCHELVLIHRLGTVPVGEPSLYLQVKAERRGTAFRIAEELIQRLKADVPIWKAAVASSLLEAFPETAAKPMPSPVEGS
ncbi:molybdopterin synthase catalytic subunit [Methylacidimicrobium tartarophylax]|uniref:Molybdopterin synthase catalytic subunit n=1 Tax=Methylacidimicrobium tartarophylax TaxID=1041768 RepID=A0A5E6MA46_9BACT|nr:molybdenum cofactor biosynthesis protein MoaE [Methylacidimicrobium tartarophylax]VVM06078.1 molybdopterin synthase catalytic subunit [Methylacidimicrobium tartarophylax]